MNTTTGDKSRLKRDLSKQAIDLALRGEWQRATEVNQALLALYPDDMDSMNRLGKAFMELGDFGRSREVLSSVVEKAPYNTIAQKNLNRLNQMEVTPSSGRQTRISGSVSNLFIAESGKSGTTVLQKAARAEFLASIAPGDPVTLEVRNQSILAFVRENEYLGQVEPKLALRLARLIGGGNRYEAAVVGLNDRGISLIIRETYRHPSLHNISSFPTNSRGVQGTLVSQGAMRYLGETDLDEDEEGAVEHTKLTDFDSEWDE